MNSDKIGARSVFGTLAARFTDAEISTRKWPLTTTITVHVSATIALVAYPPRVATPTQVSMKANQMKKILSAVAALSCIMIGASFSPAAPAQAQAQTGACLDASGHIGLDPSPITATQLKEQGITISASGLPANALGQAVIVKEDLRTLSEIYSEYYQDERAAAVADFFKVAMSPLPAVGYQGFVDWGDEKNEHLGYFMTDAEGNMSLTFGGNENKQQEFPIRAILDQYVADGYLSEEDLDDYVEYIAEVEAGGWSSTPPDFEDGYEGNYSVAFLLNNFVTGDSYRFFLYDGTLFATEFESEEFSQHHDRQLERLIEAGFPEDEAVYADAGLGAGIICTEFTVVEDSAPSESPTPEPSTSPTPEPSTSPTPEPSTSPTPEPSTSPTPEPNSSPTPEPSTSPTPEPNSTPSPAPSAPPSASVGSTGSLPQTGGDVYGVLTAGGILLAAGGTLVVLARRRSVTR